MNTLRQTPHMRSIAARFLVPNARPLSSIAADDNVSFTIDVAVPFKGHHIEPSPQVAQTSSKKVLTFAKDMSCMRRMEIAADQLYKSKFTRGFCHIYNSQEAACIGMEAALTRGGNIITVNRDHCTYLGEGGTLPEVFSEVIDRKDGCTHGKDEMRTTERQAAKSSEDFERGDYVPSLKSSAAQNGVLQQKPKRVWTTYHNRTSNYLKLYVLKTFFSNKYITAQVYHTPTSTVAAAASSQEKNLRQTMETHSDCAAAAQIGGILASRLKEKEIPAIHFYYTKTQRYHGKLKALIDSIRGHGINFLG